MHRILLALIILFQLYAVLPAQSIFSASKNGIGLRHYSSSVRGSGMGATGLALSDSISLNAYNIASWSTINNTRINLSLRYHWISTQISMLGQSQSLTRSTANFEGLQLAIPLQKKRWVIGASISPYALTNFNYSYDYQQAEISYKQNVFYEGNIARSQISLIWSPHRRMGFAASLNYFFGAIKDRYYLIFNNSQLSDQYYKIEYRFRGPGIGLSTELRPFDHFILGGFIDFKPRISYTQLYVSPISYEEKSSLTKTSFPIFAGIGASYRLGTSWLISSDIIYQDWSKGLKLNSPVNNLEEFSQVGVGLEHTRAAEKTRKFLNKFDSRIGFSYSKIGYIFNSISVQEYAMHIGFGFTFFREQARLDLAFIGGIRGNQEKTLAEEKFIKSMISISAGELWFQKQR